MYLLFVQRTLCTLLALLFIGNRTSSAQCLAEAGALDGGGDEVCLENGSVLLLGEPDGDAVVPFGYNVLFLLSQAGVLLDTAEEPAFMVSEVGVFRLHTFVFDTLTFDAESLVPNVTGILSLFALTEEGGGSLCADLDTQGLLFSVADCGFGCGVQAGSMIGGGVVCLFEGDAALAATPAGNAVVPAGFQVAYILSTGFDLTVVEVSTVPSFNVQSIGLYAIHTFVYDPNTFDTTTIVPGETSAFDIYALTAQGGGALCANLDVFGAEFAVPPCPPGCTASAGSLEATEPQICSGDKLLAALVIPPQVPVGYEVRFLLTSATDQVILQQALIPSFYVDVVGDYRLHTLVYNPNTLDLGNIELGATTTNEVDSMLIQGGGSVCGSLDLEGAAITVIQCGSNCIAQPGSLLPFKEDDCLYFGYTAIGAQPDGNAVVPVGYQVVYLLTRGPALVYEAYNTSAVFLISEPDLYTIHTLVHDPATLNIGAWAPGVTTVADVLATIVQGGGTVCAGFDAVGLSIPVNDPRAGTTEATGETVCFTGITVIGAEPTGDAVVPSGYALQYVLSRGPELLIQDVGVEPFFLVDEVGEYNIHSVVLRTEQATSGYASSFANMFALVGTLSQFGQFTCGNVDLEGTAITVVACEENGEAGEAAGLDAHLTLFSAWPAPVKDVLYVGVTNPTEGTFYLQVLDMLGRAAIEPVTARASAGSSVHAVNMGALASGQYLLVLDSGAARTVRSIIVTR
jgi:Secretion system C-terminal sorting domain